MAAIRKAKQNSLPIILQPHGTYLNYNTHQLAKSVFDLLFGQLITTYTNHFVAISELEKQDLINQGIDPQKISVSPNGITLSSTKSANLKLPSNYLLYLGRLDGMKGLEWLITSFSVLRQFKPGLKLVIAGTGNPVYINSLKGLAQEKQVKKHITWFGHASPDQKQTLLKNARLTLYLSSKEAFGLVPLESILTGTPVIISDHVGSAPWVKRSKAGIIVSSNDQTTLVSLVEDLLDHPMGQSRLKQAKTYLASRLAWPRIAQQMENLYFKFLK